MVKRFFGPPTKKQQLIKKLRKQTMAFKRKVGLKKKTFMPEGKIIVLEETTRKPKFITRKIQLFPSKRKKNKLRKKTKNFRKGIKKLSGFFN